MRAVVAIALGLLLQEDFLPLKEGTRWTYRIEDVGAEATEAPREVVAEVGAAAAAGDEWTRISNFLGYSDCYLRATDAGIDLKIEAAPEAPSLRILKLPVRSSDEWKGSLGPEELAFTTRGEEQIEIGDRRLRAVRVEFTVADAKKHAGHAPTRGDVWFVSGLGIVKAQVTKDLDCHSAATKVYLLKP